MDCLLSPKSIVIVGASADFSKLNGISLRALIDKQYAGALYPVNPKYSEIAGIECHPTVEDVPGLVDLAIVAVPQNSVLESIHALGRKKVAAAIIFSSGFAEVGVEGMRRQAEIAAAAKAGGVRILGPNCLGVVNAFESVMASFAQLTLGDTRGGPFALVTQSGALGSAIIGVAKKRGLHFGYFVATGNECDVGFVEVMEEVLRDPRIKVGAGFIESVRDGPGLVRLASSALSNGRPLVLCKLGRTPAGAKAVASHTGSLAGSDRVFDGICRQYGIVRARHDEQLLDFVSAFVNCPLPEGRRLGVLTRSGGAGALMADRANEVGLEMAVLTEETCERLKGILPEFGSFQNPVDVTGMGMFNPGMIGDAFQMVLDDPHVDVGIIWMGSTREVDFMVKVFLDLRRKARKPFVIAWVGVSDTAMQALTAGTVAVFRGSEPAVDAVAALTAYAQMRRHWEADRLVGEVAASPDIELPMIDGPVPAPMACQILTRWGIHIAPLSLAATADEAVRIAAAVGPPVALKIESPDISHKTEAKGVMLNLLGSEAIRRGFADIISHAHAYSPQARIEGVVVQKMMSGDVELVVGLTNDAVFGAVIMVGLGGILVEVMAEVAIRRAPVTEAQAGRMLHELRGAAILDGVRGKPAVDKKALMRFIATVSCFGAAAGDRLVALDLNPVLVSSQSVVAVDALLVLKNS
jgi:acetyltransferase